MGKNQNKFLRVIVNLVDKKWVKILVGSGVILSSSALFSGCGNSNSVTDEIIDASVFDVLDYNSHFSSLDEVLAFNGTINVKEVNGNSEISSLNNDVSTSEVEISFVESICRLEKYVNLLLKINELELEGESTLSNSDLIAELKSMSYGQVMNLIVDYDNNKLNVIEHVRIEEKIKFLKNYYCIWIKNNGYNICEELLKQLVKSSVCYATGVEPEYYDSFTIQRVNSSYHQVVFNDPISGKNFVYQVPLKPIDSESGYGIFHDCIDKIVSIQIWMEELKNDKYLDYSECESILETCVYSLEYVKRAVHSGCYLYEGNNLCPVITYDDSYEDLKIKIKENKIPSYGDSSYRLK